MRRNIVKRVLATLVIAALTIGLVAGSEPAMVYAEATAVTVLGEGKCGDNASWKLMSDGTIYISGTGETYDYWDNSRGTAFDRPWSTYTNKIRRVVVEKGITKLGDCLFYNTRVEKLEGLENVKTIGDAAFFLSFQSEKLVIPDSVEYIGGACFQYCCSIKEVVIGKNVKIIEVGAFDNCMNLRNVYFEGTQLEKVGEIAFANTYMDKIVFPFGNEKIAYDVIRDSDKDTTIYIPCTAKITHGSTEVSNYYDGKEYKSPKYSHDCDSKFLWNSDNSCMIELTCKNCSFAEKHDATVDKVHIKDGTCVDAGVDEYVAKYSNEYAEYSSTKQVATEMNPSNHVGEKKECIENRVEPSYNREGSYDKVVYCGDCKAELSREKVTIPMLEKPKTADGNKTDDGNKPDNGNVSNSNDNVSDSYDLDSDNLEEGSEETVDIVAKYRVGKYYYIGKVSEGKMAFAGTVNKNAKAVTVPNTVTINGVKCKIVAISKNAFTKNKKLKTVVIGANVTEIGKKAFYGCKSLKTVTVKSKKLKYVGKNAFKKVNKACKVLVPKTKYKKYKKLFKNVKVK